MHITGLGVGPPWERRRSGRFESATLESEALRGNPLGDPHVRPILVYLPPGYDEDLARRYPAIYVLQGFTGQLDMLTNRSPFRPNFPELCDALFSGEAAPPAAIVVFVDAWTSLGGSQFVDSTATGRYHTYLCQDVVAWIDANYRTLAIADHRGVSGKSSGGYGAMITAMLRPDVFGGMASHAGDALFEASYLPDFPVCVRLLRDHYQGSFERFWADFRSRPADTGPGDDHLLNLYAMAAAYSADEDGTVRMPIDLATGELLPDVWERWLTWDPVRMVPQRAEALRSLRAIYLDAGRRDEFFLDLGAEAVRRAMEHAGVADVRFELFDAGHMSIDYRYPAGLRYLAERLAPASGAR